MERQLRDKEYYVAIETDKEYKPSYRCLFADIERAKKSINKGHVLACVTYDDGRCALYYNEGGYPKEELRKAGYQIVRELEEVAVYEESTIIYENK